MKKLFSILFVAATFTAVSQPKKAPKMAPTLAPGYYVPVKGDTIKGEVMSNPEDETAFYKGFSFKPAKGGKLVVISPKKAKAYGYDDKHFFQINYEGEEMYVEVLARGRLNLYELRYNGKIDGYPAIEASYFVQDNNAEGEDVKLKELKKISNKFYKKDLKPYMKDQTIIWNDLDKYVLNKQALTNAFIEFNKFYVIAKPE
jgi:hypothetical protein